MSYFRHSGIGFRHSGAACVLIAALSLGACAGGASRVPQGSGTTATAPVGDVAPAPPPLASLPPPESANPPNDAQGLIGVKGDTLRHWIGETVFVRRDGIAEIWRFAAESCFLDVFLYREKDGLRIAHLDARPKAGSQRITPQSCYGTILAERKTKAAS